MIQDVNKAIKLVEEQLLKINQTDNSLSTIYNTFTIKNTQEKEQCLEQYINLLKKRKELLEPVAEVVVYLSQIISNLCNIQLGFVDRFLHGRKIKNMKKQIKESVEFQEDDSAVDEIKVEITPDFKQEIKKGK
jgi:hypothetical protein